MRAFIAVDIPENVKRKLVKVTMSLNSPNFRPVRECNMHITLAFMPDITEKDAESIISFLKNLKENLPEDSLEILNPIFFPTPSFPRVCALEITDEKGTLRTLVDKVNSFLIQENIIFDDTKKFSPHLTLGRFRNFDKRKDFELINTFSKESEKILGTRWTLPCPVLIQSIIKSGEPPYYERLS